MPIINSIITDTTNITQNGTYNVTKYTTANVNVEGTQPTYKSISISPSKNTGTFIASDMGADGFDRVTAFGVTSEIDSNIQPENIKKDVTILGVTGTHEGGVTPSGTKTITGNGTYDVVAFATATVNVPTEAKPRCIEFIEGSEGLKRGGYFMNFNGVHKIAYMGCAGAYQNAGISNTPYPSVKMEGGVDMSTITTVGDSGFSNTFRQSGLTGDVNFDSLTSIGNGSFSYCFTQSGIKTLSMNSLTTMAKGHAMEYMCQKCTSLTSVSMPNLSFIWYDYAVSYCFQGCTSLQSVNLHNLQHIGLTAIPPSSYSLYNDCYQYMFAGCTSLTNVDLTSLKGLGGTGGYMFQGCTSLTNIDLGSLEYIISTSSNYSATGAAGMMFAGCTNLTNVNLKSLTGICGTASSYYQSCAPAANMFNGCTSLVSQKFESLTDIAGNYYMNNMFNGCTSLSSVWFYALKSSSFGSSSNQFYQMLNGCSDVTVHFPSNLQSVIGSWSDVQNGFGGTNTTVLFDLPQTYLIYGNDSKEYERNPKCDTATSLSWRVAGTGVTSTPYYTAGTSDPNWGLDYIYSDPECTQIVTQISE